MERNPTGGLGDVPGLRYSVRHNEEFRELKWARSATKHRVSRARVLLEVIAVEVERGYDLSKATLVRVGRPSLGAAGVSPRVNFRIPPDLYEAARVRAGEEGCSLSELTREALRKYVGA